MCEFDSQLLGLQWPNVEMMRPGLEVARRKITSAARIGSLVLYESTLSRACGITLLVEEAVWN